MLAKHLIFPSNIKHILTIATIFRRSHTWHRQLKIVKQPLKPILSNYARHASTKSAAKKNLPIILGLSAVGWAVAAYLVGKKKTPSIPEDTEEYEEEPFVQEHLQEDLALLSEFGPVPYLLIGAGCASFTAYRAIRTNDPTAKVLIIGEEPYFPYMRPPLSKEAWFDTKVDCAETLSFTQWDGKNRSIFYEPSEYYFSVKDLLEKKNGGISVIRGKRVIKIDPESQIVYLDKGEKISYEKCLIATGSKPKNLQVFEQADHSIKKHISFYKTVQDFRKLDKTLKKIKSIVVVGGGFLGSELAIGLAKKGKPSGLEVIQLFPEAGNMGKVLPEYLSMWTSTKLATEGIKVVPEVNVKSVAKEGNKVNLVLSNGKILNTDHIIVAVGSEPDTEMAKASGLEIDEKHGGFLVNAEMEARKNLWVAGDASCFYDINLGRRRVEHHDHAVVSGRLAGDNMAGNHKPYRHQSMIWSDLGPDIGFEAIGLIDSSFPTIGVFTKEDKNILQLSTENMEENPSEIAQQVGVESETLNSSPRPPEPDDRYGKGVLFYLKNDIIVGIVLWNVFAKIGVARQIINESKSSDDVSEIAKLFDLYSTEQ